MSVTEENFVAGIGTDFEPALEENVFDTLFKEYERVVVNSLITSFGLDFFIKDQHGGDVDTIHNVRKIDKDPDMRYKNTANETAYNNRGEYNSDDYHKHSNYIARGKGDKQKQQQGELKDAYTGNKMPINGNRDTDHVVSAKEIHDDRGAVLSGRKGSDLANLDENLRSTNSSINRSKGKKTVEEYIEWLEKTQDHRDGRISTLKSKSSLTDKERKELSKLEQQNAVDKEEMRRDDRIARGGIDADINKSYYTSSKFLKDTGHAAVFTGVKMGLRQAMGLVFTEVWFSAKEALTVAGAGFAEKLKSIGEGIKQGFSRAKVKYKEVLSKFGAGTISGILSSLTTTLTNIFFTTSKNAVRIIRQTWASLMEAAKILIFNPDNLHFAERLKAALKILAAGASVVLGTMVQESVQLALSQSLGAMPVVGNEILSIVSMFSGTLCTGLLTVSSLYLIDSDPFGGLITKILDDTIGEYKHQAKLFEVHAAKLQQLDIDKFESEVAAYCNLVSGFEKAKNDTELNIMLTRATKQLGIPVPWGENRSLDDFMNDPSAVFHF